MFYTSDITRASPSWGSVPGRASFFTTDGPRVVATASNGIYYCPNPPSCSWSSKGGVSTNLVAISGSNVVALSTSGTTVYTSDITVGSPAWVTIGGASLNQVSISGSSLLGITTSGAIVYCSSAPSCSWQTKTGGVSGPAVVSLNGAYASVVDVSGKTYYTSSIGASSVTWTENTGAPSLEAGGVGSFTV
jgi:hypothetical protein